MLLGGRSASLAAQRRALLAQGARAAPAVVRGRGVAVAAMFNFNWPWSPDNKKEGGGGGGKFGDILAAARAPRRAGTQLAPKEAPPGLALATLGAGCFWGLELAFQRVPGVTSTLVGYAGGEQPAPTYDEVCMGLTGHAEVVRVAYDPKEVTYERLLDVFFDRHDPTTRNRQGNDRGPQYRSIILAHGPEQRAAAQRKIDAVNAQLAAGGGGGGAGGGLARVFGGRSVTTELVDAGDVWVAEKYHQQYLERGGRFGMGQSAAKGCTDKIRCYG